MRKSERGSGKQKGGPWAVWLLQPVAQSGLYQPSIYLSIYLSVHIAIAGTSAGKLQNMACVQELANRSWAGRDVEMIIKARPVLKAWAASAGHSHICTCWLAVAVGSSSISIYCVRCFVFLFFPPSELISCTRRL